MWYSDTKSSDDQPLQVPSDTSWSIAARNQLTDLGESISPAAMATAREILEMMAAFPVSQPAITDDEDGGIEIFFNEGECALLVAVRRDSTLRVFGDRTKEQWRAIYGLQGQVWRRQLLSHASELLPA